MRVHKDDSANLMIWVFFILSIVPLIIFSGYTITVLWEWFVIPLFDLPALTIPQALGLATVVTYFTKQYGLAERQEDENPYKNLGYMLGLYIRPAGALLWGWILLQFM